MRLVNGKQGSSWWPVVSSVAIWTGSRALIGRSNPITIFHRVALPAVVPPTHPPPEPNRLPSILWSAVARFLASRPPCHVTKMWRCLRDLSGLFLTDKRPRGLAAGGMQIHQSSRAFDKLLLLFGTAQRKIPILPSPRYPGELLPPRRRRHVGLAHLRDAVAYVVAGAAFPGNRTDTQHHQDTAKMHKTPSRQAVRCSGLCLSWSSSSNSAIGASACISLFQRLVWPAIEVERAKR